MFRKALCLTLSSLACLSVATAAPSEPAPELGKRPTLDAARGDMNAAYQSFKTLYPYLFSASEFQDPAHRDEIARALDTFSTRFNHLNTKGLSNEPGFRTSLELVLELIEDAHQNFKSGNLEFARWRLRSLGNYCLTCHTRAKVDLDYFDSDPGLSQLSKVELGEFYLASHQFEKAREVFLESARESRNPADRMQALRNWLIIVSRIEQNPQRALKELNQLRHSISFGNSESQELAAWTDSLRRWINETTLKQLGPLPLADRLTTIGAKLAETNYPGGGAVELLRATGILHAVLVAPTATTDDHAQALLLLGSAYAKLPQFFVDDLPQSFLEQAIREKPHSALAQEAFDIYRDVVELGFTGSGGTNLPPDVQAKLDELRSLVFATAKAPSR